LNGDILNTIEYLKDRGNLLPYATAQGFCYTNLMHFAPNYRPNFKRYFAPFKNWKHNTFYQIADVKTYLRVHMSDSLIKETLGSNAEIIAIVRVLIAGLTERQCDEIAAMDNPEIESLLQSYKVTLIDTSDVAENSVTVRSGIGDFKFTFNKDDWDLYDLNMEYPRNNILVFTLNIA
jgi:hypothetical protein